MTYRKLPVDNTDETAANAQKVGTALQGASAATVAVPWVSAGLAAAGTLSNLYGGYKQQQMADMNYDQQMKEYKRLQAIDEYDRQRRIKLEALKQQMDVSNFGDQNDQNRMAQYAKYFSQIGR